MTNLPSLADRRLYLKLCSLYKIVHDLSYFPPDIVVPKVTRSYTSTPFTLYQPFSHTNCFLNSFIPQSVSHWNILPELVEKKVDKYKNPPACSKSDETHPTENDRPVSGV